MKNYLVVSTLMSVLTLSIHSAQQVQRPTSFKLSSYVKSKRLFLELASLCTDDEDIERKDLLRLLKHVKMNKIAQVFSIDTDTFNRYFNEKYFKKFIEYALDVDSEDKKRKAFKKTFTIKAWEESLQCNNLDTILEPLSQVLFLKSDDPSYARELTQLKTALLNLQSDEDDIHPLESIVNVKELLQLLSQKEAGHEVAASDVIKTLYVDHALTKISGDANKIRTYTNLRKTLSCMVAVCCAHTKEELPTLFDIATCIRWDAILFDVSKVCSKDKGLLLSIFVQESLSTLIEKFQDDIPVTAQDVKATLNKEILQFLDIDPERLHLYIDCSIIAQSLNNIRKSTTVADLIQSWNELFRALNLKKIGQQLGMENQKDDWVEVIRQSWPGWGPTCLYAMSSILPNDMVSSSLLLGASLYGSHKASQCLNDLPLTKRILVNATISKGERTFKRIVGQNWTVKEQILGLIPPAHPLYAYLQEFTDMITQEHLETLSDPATLINVYLDPYKFIKTEPDFVEAICTGTPEHAAARIDFIWEQLDRVKPYESLCHTGLFSQFAALISSQPDIMQTLPHEKYMELAKYYPRMLMQHDTFIKGAASLFVLEAQDSRISLVTLLIQAIEKAEESSA